MTTCTTIDKADNLDPASVNDQTLSGISVSYADRITKSHTLVRPLEWLVGDIKSSPELQSSIAIVRSQSTQDDRQKAKKLHLPWFTFARFKNDYRSNGNFLSSGHIIIDLDHLGDKIGLVREQAKRDPRVMVAFLSPSGDGIKLVFALEKSVLTADEFRRAFNHLRELVEAEYVVEVDDDDDPARACFLSYDPEIWVNPDRRVVAIPESVPTPKNHQLRPHQAVINHRSVERFFAFGQDPQGHTDHRELY